MIIKPESLKFVEHTAVDLATWAASRLFGRVFLCAYLHDLLGAHTGKNDTLKNPRTRVFAQALRHRRFMIDKASARRRRRVNTEIT